MAEADRLVVVCQVTEACNLGCAFCGYDRRLPFPRMHADAARLRRLGHDLAALRRRTGRRVLVSWLGGEPLLWGELPALTRALRGLGLEMGVTTNGTTLGAAAARAEILDSYDEVTVSVDGHAEVHDRLRGWKGGFAFLSRAVSALAEEKRRRGAGPRLRANTVLMRDNLGELRSLCLELAAWGFEELTFNQLGGRDRPEFYPDHRLRPLEVERLRDALPALRAELAARGVRLLGGARYLERLEATTGGRALPVADCGFGTRFLFVSRDGRVAPCSFTAGSLGVALDDPRRPALDGGLCERFRAGQGQARPPACDDCHHTNVFGKFEAPA